MSDFNIPVKEKLAYFGVSEKEEIRRICEQLGYGRVMQLVSILWAEKTETTGFQGSEFVVGPCKAGVVECTHPGADPYCDWCHGGGWLTKEVAELVKEKTKGIK